MRSAVLQFLLAGALVVAWIWMLGRPLLTMLARRSRRDSVGHFRSQQVALGRTVGLEPPTRLGSSLLRPFVEWRAQPLPRRRLQILLGGALATFASALLAIALRGSYLRLFLVMVTGFVLHLAVAAWIGGRELRAQDAELRRRSIDAATERAAGRSVAGRTSDRPGDQDDPYEIDDLLADDRSEDRTFDDGFFAPIPELETPVAPTTPIVDEPATPAAAADRVEPSFTSPAATVRPRPGRRPKGRPIYVEPDRDEGDGTARAAND